MNRFIYTILMYLSLPFAVLRILIKDSKNKSWKQKLKNQLGFVNNLQGKVIWIHCVSVGEFNAAKPLIDQLLKKYPSHKLVITTTTITGADATISHYQNRVIHYFFPFDLPFIVDSFINKINPITCILLETEIWPNLINSLNKKAIPVVLINARLSERSFDKYQRFSSKLVEKTINQFTFIGSQNNPSRERFLSLGASPDKVIMVGNLKFDSHEKINSALDEEIRLIVGKRDIIVFASTRNGEENQIIQSYNNLKEKFDALLFIIPRHPERFDEVFNMVSKTGLKVARRSENLQSNNMDVLIGDSMGEMMAYYKFCHIAFIGGSLSNTGGQNMLEAASASKPIIFGPSVYNFEEVAKSLLKRNAAIQVGNSDELMQTISELLLDKKRQLILGKNAKSTYEKNQGSINKVIELITPVIES